MGTSDSPAVTRGETDTFDVFDLAKAVGRRWRIVVAMVVLGLAVAIAYLYLATPRYEVSVRVDRPFASQLAALNIGRTEGADLTPYTADDVFGYFLGRLRSEEAFQRFFAEVYLPSLDEGDRNTPKSRLYERARKLVEVRVPTGKAQDSGLHAVRVHADGPDKALEWLGVFLGQVETDSRKAFLEVVRGDLDVRIRNADRELNERRTTASQLRADRVRQLREALAVAKAAGITDPQLTAGRPSASESATPFVDDGTLYARGAKSLAAELAVLQAREDDDGFISGLREVESRLRTWKAIVENLPADFPMYRKDGDAMTPEEPVAPRRGLVLALAVVLGAAAGVVLALIAEALRGHRRSRAPADGSRE